MPEKTINLSHKAQHGGHNLVDMAGQRFGRLTVIAHIRSTGRAGATWLCVCDCGNEIIVLRASLRTGNTRSCGCIGRRPPGEAAKTNLFNTYKKDARRRELLWEIEADTFHVITQEKCHYCGAPPSRRRSRSNNGEVVFNGLDRVDNNGGYTPLNVVPCCYTCNRAKGEMSATEFKDWIHRVHQHLHGTEGILLPN